MGFIEEGRQLIQDFVTPEIRSIDARLTAVEKRVESLDAKVDKRFDSVDKRFDSLETEVDKRFDSLETEVDKRFDSLEGKMERNQAQVLDTLQRMENYSHILERLARVESKLQSVA
jgi:tetrahydromethanopterin S-methyltransferase subunit G